MGVQVMKLAVSIYATLIGTEACLPTRGKRGAPGSNMFCVINAGTR